ncbi:TPA: hypothetical protein TVB72_001370 [Streptococcus equi subsp. zooepidemicus]|nr:hypothetical protein [Streptococcus equi subsp. zooepidemicus]
MRKLMIPSFYVEDIFSDLITGIRKVKNIYGVKKEYRELFEECKDKIFLFEQFYMSLASTGDLDLLLPEACSVSEHIGYEEMKYLYEERLRKTFNDSLYLWLKTNEKHNFYKCSYCERGDVSELDHLLPQSQFPVFAVTPLNLIPSCHECNHNKLDDMAIVINPYFEDTTEDNWLVCKIDKIHDDYVAKYQLDFSKTGYSLKLQSKIINTYSMGRNSILDRYSIWGNNRLADKIALWKTVLSDYGIDRFAEMLEAEISSMKTCSINSYEISLYRGILDYVAVNKKL